MTHSTLNDQYFCRLHQTLVNALDGGELRTLCAKLNVNYDRLPGESKTDKAAALIASLHRDGRIHALLKASPELRNSARSEATSSSTANNPSPALTKMEQRKRFLRSFFPGQPIAFEEDLCNSWELIATRIIHKSGPDYVRQGITSLADDLAGVDFIADFELQEQESSQLDAQGKLRVEDQASQLDQAYVNYHSVCLWYRSVRSIVKLLLAPFTFIGILILC
ncbi:MAG: hypothetical protein SVR04_15565, partial [Spirochaetota bacterium]|nr:hypothetical protein [Spirochaetota bacterium]